MSCGSTREGLVMAMSGTVPPELADHLAVCDACKSELDAMRRVWGALDLTADPPAPLVQSTLAAVQARARSYWPEALGAGVLGSALATGTLAVRGLLDRWPTAAGDGGPRIWVIIAMAAVWVALFGAMALVGMRNRSRAPIAALAAGGALLALGGRCFCPLKVVGGVLRAATGLPQGAILLLAGATYAFVPVALLGLALGGAARGRPVREGLVAGAAFAAALVPALLTGCRPFALGLLAAEAIGTLLGGVLGATSALALRRATAASQG